MRSSATVRKVDDAPTRALPARSACTRPLPDFGRRDWSDHGGTAQLGCPVIASASGRLGLSGDQRPAFAVGQAISKLATRSSGCGIVLLGRGVISNGKHHDHGGET